MKLILILSLISTLSACGKTPDRKLPVQDIRSAKPAVAMKSDTNSYKIMQKGDIVKCAPGVTHWHGGSHHTKLTHIAIATNSERGPVVWLNAVADQEYNQITKTVK